MAEISNTWLDKDFIITAEIFPPKGTNIESFKRKAGILKDYVDAVNVTDNQRAVMRTSSLALSKILLDMGIEPVYQLTCRDRNRLAIQSDLLGAWVLGIRTVLALSGDFPTHGDHPGAKPVYDLDTVQLIYTISNLNKGIDLAGNKLEGKTDFIIGGVCNPLSFNPEIEYLKIKKKIEAGAVFFQTQAVYEVEKYKNFVMKLKKEFPHVKFIAGVMPLKSSKMAYFLNEKVPGIVVPEKIIERMENSTNPVETGILIIVEIIKRLKEFADGVHIMAIKMEEKIPYILERI